MKVGIVDADLLGRTKHRFPNLACEKISGYWKEQGAEVRLITSYDEIHGELSQIKINDAEDDFDKIYISKVFTDTEVPDWISELALIPQKANQRIQIGGTGFYFDNAPPLSNEIEHHMPDYHLYDEWIENERQKAEHIAENSGREFNLERFMLQFKEYTDYSIGFLTRGCFRKCQFCVNQKYDKVFLHSPLEEFYQPERKKICLLDDNVFGCGSHWKELFLSLKATGKPFKFKQGMDERILTNSHCELLFSSNYDGDYTFAFDNIEDYDIIHKKLKLIRQYASPKANIKFYVLVGFESTDEKDIENAFKRIELLMRYHCLPYIMRYQDKNDAPWKSSEYRGMYIALARWANQPNIFKKMSFRQFCQTNQDAAKTDKLCAPMQALLKFQEKHPDIADKYFDLCYSDYYVSDML